MKKLLTVTLLAAGLCLPAHAGDDDKTSPAIAAKLMLRGDAGSIKVAEMRISRKNDVLVVQADLQNKSKFDTRMYYRFRWLDANGSQVGDDTAWNQLNVMGKQQTTIKGVAAHSSVTDFRIEMNME
ncbi:YcfL family protein [Chitinimonas sp. BJYL2]|uniref:YcfL family protein n=1 Tax=Chitinimonas sp. BJYL2 TaxID=2976696 RepID=UPI0022B5B3D5|nr:YcfL family protein [Chitinimonas sp. BJYL2]